MGLARICRFYSSNQSVIEYSVINDIYYMTTLDEYLSRMKEGQKNIYFFTTNNAKNATKVAFVEKLVKKGYEVVYMTDPLDEYVAMNLSKYKNYDNNEEYNLIDVTRERLEIGDEKKNYEKIEKRVKIYLTNNL